jgi:hypothetical protein
VISFRPASVPQGSSSAAEWEYCDPATGRSFEVRRLRGPTAIEAISPGRHADDDAVRYFVSEFIPNGRLVKDGATPARDEYIDIPDKIWARARKHPSKARAAIKAAQAANPGFAPISSSDGLGAAATFYASLEACAKPVQNALDADVWLESHEPEKCLVLAERCRITLKANSLLARMPGNDQIMAAVLDIAGLLPRHEEVRVSEHLGDIRVEVQNATKDYPDSCRLLLLFVPSGHVAPKGGFVSGGWGEIADRLARRELPRYDGPDGIAHGFPAYGQAIGFPVRKPDGVGLVEVLHKQEGTANKVYAYAEVNGRRIHAWGRFASGKLQSQPATGSGYGKLSEKRDRGYRPIEPEQVPDFWERLMAAAQARPA